MAARRASPVGGVVGSTSRSEPGERVLLLGASGSGKSTLLRGLAGVLGDDEDGEQTGELLIDGLPAGAARGRVGLVLQDPDAQVVLARVGDDVAFGCENLGLPQEEIWPRVRAALDAVGLDCRAGPVDGCACRAVRSSASPSRGCSRCSRACCCSTSRRRTWTRTASARCGTPSSTSPPRTGATLVVVEHRVDVWAPHVDRVIVLGADGGVLADGPPDAVFASHERELTDAGVWVPGVRPEVPTATRRTPGADVLLEARGLAVGRRAFGSKTATVAASEIDASAIAGRALAVVGPNGTGKSTLALTLAGLLRPAAGEVRASAALRGAAATDPLQWRSAELLTRIGMVFQSPEHQLLAGTVRGELEIGPRALGLDEAGIGRRVEPLLERLRLTRLAQVNPFTLSGGEKRRLTVAAALATGPAGARARRADLRAGRAHVARADRADRRTARRRNGRGVRHARPGPGRRRSPTTSCGWG